MTRRLVPTLAFWLALLPALPAGAAADGPAAFRRVAIPDDVPAHLCTALAQDRDGFVWIGTQGGLVRYDGYAFRVFRPGDGGAASLGGSYVRAIRPASDGRVWVGTFSGGASVYDPKTETFTTYRASGGAGALSDDDVEAIAEDPSGRVWLATDKGLDRLDPAGRAEHFRADPADPSALAHDRVRELLVGRDGCLWVGTRDGLQRWRGEGLGFERVASDPGAPGSLAGQFVSRLFEDSRGRLWVGTTESGAAVVDPATGAVVRRLPPAPGSPDGLSHFWVSGFAEVGGEVWVATYGGGVDVVDAATLRVVHRLRHDGAVEDTVGGDRVGAMMRDRSGVVWVGTWGQGIALHDPSTRAFRAFRHSPTRPDGLSHPAAVRALEMDGGAVWVGTNGNGVDVLGPDGRLAGGFRPDPADPGALADGSVTCLARAADGTAWVATLGGVLHRLRPGARRFERITAAEGLPRGPIRAMAFGPDGALWVGAAEGLGRVDPATGRAVAYQHRPGDDASLSGSGAEALAFTADGTLWVGTNGGLNAFDTARGTAVRVLHDPDRRGGLPNNWVPDLMVARDGRLWVATQSGACVLASWDGREATFDLVSERLGRPPGPVDSLIEDDDGRVWLGPRLRVDPRTWEAREFGPADGCAFRSFFIASRARTSDGRLLFGSPEGLLVVRPDRLEPWAFEPPLVATALQVDGAERPAGALGGGLTLEPDRRGFRLDFAALDFTAPARGLYRYRLEGYDREWVTTDAARRSAAYTSLPPGSYTLVVEGTNRAGAWSPHALRVPVTVLPAFYQTAWFRGAAALAALAAAYAVYRWRVRRLRARGRELERTVAERTAALAEAVARLSVSEREALEAKDDAERAREAALEATRAKSVFLANMSHELRTPLNAVLGFSQLMARDGRIPAEQQDSLRIIRRSGEHLLELINDVLSLSKIEAGRLALDRKPFDLPVLLDTVRSVVLVRAEAKGLEIRFELAPGLPRFVLGDEGKLRQVLINLLGNAVKFTDRGAVTLRAGWEDGRAAFDVEDTGRGISEAEIGTLFDAFMQTESGRQSKEGTGLGLVISRQIVRLMGGEIAVRSRAGEGTTFSFEAELPESDAAPERDDRGRVAGLAPGQAPPRVLVADDTPENRLLLVRLLSDAGCEVREAANGAEAVEVWRAWRPDLIFMDMRMPVVDGRKATRAIREDERSTNGHESTRTKIVALTASAFEHERQAILADGCDDLVTKPFRVETIFARIAEHAGVRFREEAPGGAGAGDAPALTPERLAALPAAVARELYEALADGDFEAAAEAAGRAGAADAALADALLAEIRAFRLDELLSLLERVGPGAAAASE